MKSRPEKTAPHAPLTAGDNPTADEAAAAPERGLEREKRRLLMQQEDHLHKALGPYRVGSVCYLNAVPLTRGLEDEVVFTTPSKLAEMLRRRELDGALVSVTEPLLCDGYYVLDGVAVASLGEVQSVLLAHRGPIEQAREVYCDPASLTSVNLLKVLLAERGVRPTYKPLESYEAKRLPDYALLIGDQAIDLVRGPHEHQILDLGTAWYELTGLPFVYAVWAIRRDVTYGPLAAVLRQAQRLGLETLDQIIRDRPEYDYDFRKDYLGWHVHYHLGPDERRGLEQFARLLEKHGLGPVFELKFVTG